MQVAGSPRWERADVFQGPTRLVHTEVLARGISPTQRGTYCTTPFTGSLQERQRSHKVGESAGCRPEGGHQDAARVRLYRRGYLGAGNTHHTHCVRKIFIPMYVTPQLKHSKEISSLDAPTVSRICVHSLFLQLHSSSVHTPLPLSPVIWRLWPVSSGDERSSESRRENSLRRAASACCLNESDSLFIASASLLWVLNQDCSLSASLPMDRFLPIGLNVHKSAS